MNKQIRKISVIVLVLILALSIFSCKKEEEEEVSTAATPGFADETVTELNSVSTNFIPDSMATSSSSSSLKSRFGGSDGPLYAGDDDPCTGTDLFGCQPRLVKLYVANSKYMFDATTAFLTVFSRHLGLIPDGESGVVNMSDGSSLHFSKTSASDWSILSTNSAGTFLDFSASSGGYNMKMDFSKNPDTTEDDIGVFEIDVDYTSATSWSVEVTIIGQECNSDDVRAPERIRILINYDGAFSTGKAMLYSPRWAVFGTEPTCSTTVTDSTALALYTDFVAHNTAAKAKVYMMKRTVSDMSSMDPYDMNNLCDTYYDNFGQANAANCEAAFLIWAGLNMDDYPNPFCTTGPDHADWGSNCLGTAANVAVTAYGSSSDWTLPSAFYSEVISLRSTL